MVKCSKKVENIPQDRYYESFPLKNHLVNILNFVSHKVSNHNY